MRSATRGQIIGCRHCSNRLFLGRVASDETLELPIHLIAATAGIITMFFITLRRLQIAFPNESFVCHATICDSFVFFR
jgi:hypothetical protein